MHSSCFLAEFHFEISRDFSWKQLEMLCGMCLWSAVGCFPVMSFFPSTTWHGLSHPLLSFTKEDIRTVTRNSHMEPSLPVDTDMIVHCFLKRVSAHISSAWECYWTAAYYWWIVHPRNCLDEFGDWTGFGESFHHFLLGNIGDLNHANWRTQAPPGHQPVITVITSVV